MPISLNGSTGISVPDGSAAIPAIAAGDSDTGVFFESDHVSLSTAGTRRVEINENGQISIGPNLVPSTTNTDMRISGRDSNINIQLFGDVADPNDAPGLGLGVNAGVTMVSAFHSGTGDNSLIFRSANGGTEHQRMRITSAGRIKIGGTEDDTTIRLKPTGGSVATSQFQFRTTDFVQSQFTLFRQHSAGGPYLNLVSDRGDFETKTISGDHLGAIAFHGSPGVQEGGEDVYKAGAMIRAEAAGEWAETTAVTPVEDCPARLDFFTTPEDSDTPEERMSIRSNGNILIGGATTDRGALLQISANRGTEVVTCYQCVCDGLLLKYLVDGGLNATQRRRLTFAVGSRDSALITIAAICRRSTSNSASQHEGGEYKVRLYRQSTGVIQIHGAAMTWAYGMSTAHFVFTDNGDNTCTIDVDNSTNNSSTSWCYDITIQNSVANQIVLTSTSVINE